MFRTTPDEPQDQGAESGPLRKQKQPRSAKVGSQTPPEPNPRPKTKETVKLASGEERTVEIEATNDKEWSDLLLLAEGATALSLDQKDITHRTIAAIAALRMAHEDEWKPYCESRGMKWPKEAKSPFRPAVMWVLNQAKARTGENHTSKASMIAGCIDEYWEIERPNGMTPGKIPAWLDERGGYTKVYRDRLERLKEPKDKIAERYGRFLKLRPLEQRDIPEWLDGFGGEVVIAAHIDRNTGKLDYRSTWRPEGSAFWHGKLDQFIAARPDYGKAVEPVRAQRPEPMFDCDDGEAGGELGTKCDNGPALKPPAEAETQSAKPKADSWQTDPASKADPVVETAAESGDGNDNTVHFPVDKSRSKVEAQIAGTRIKVDGEAPPPDERPICHAPRGNCRYGGCRDQGRCLAARLGTGANHKISETENAGLST